MPMTARAIRYGAAAAPALETARCGSGAWSRGQLAGYHHCQGNRRFAEGVGKPAVQWEDRHLDANAKETQELPSTAGLRESI